MEQGCGRPCSNRRFIAFPFPSPGYINNCSGCFDFHQGFKSLKHDSTLLSTMTWLAQRVAEGPLEEDRPGWFNLFGVLSDNGDSDGGYAHSLDTPLDQSHGLIADSSTGYQQYIVNPGLLQSGSYLRDAHLHESVDVRSHYVAHECVMHVRCLSNYTR
jgi:hypothetical protein